MTLLAVYETVLRRVSGQDDFLVGTPVAGRTRAEVEGVVGCFVNTLVLRAKPDGELSFRELVSRVRATSLHAFAHQDLPFEKLVEGLGVERGLGRNPLFQVFFALANTPMDEPRLRGLSFSFVDIASEVSLFDLSLGLGELRGRMLGGFQYAADLFEESTVDRWARHFQVLLEAALADPEAALAGLPGIPEPERLQIVAEAAAETPEESAEALQDRLASRGEELAERRSALSEEKRAALKQLLRARARPK